MIDTKELDPKEQIALELDCSKIIINSVIKLINEGFTEAAICSLKDLEKDLDKIKELAK